MLQQHVVQYENLEQKFLRAVREKLLKSATSYQDAMLELTLAG